MVFGQVVIGPPIPLLREIRRGGLKTSRVKLICVDGADQMVALGEWPSAAAAGLCAWEGECARALPPAAWHPVPAPPVPLAAAPPTAAPPGRHSRAPSRPKRAAWRGRAAAETGRGRREAKAQMAGSCMYVSCHATHDVLPNEQDRVLVRRSKACRAEKGMDGGASAGAASVGGERGGRALEGEQRARLVGGHGRSVVVHRRRLHRRRGPHLSQPL